MRTEADKTAWKQKMAGISKQVKAMAPADREALAQKLGTRTPEGHTLSAWNTCFLWLQAGKALAIVAGFKQWQKAGRIVKKGEHAVGDILVPMFGNATADKTSEDATDDTSAESKPNMRFRLVPVFDIGQTDDLNQATA